jgi:hypothetical protein
MLNMDFYGDRAAIIDYRSRHALTVGEIKSGVIPRVRNEMTEEVLNSSICYVGRHAHPPCAK